MAATSPRTARTPRQEHLLALVAGFLVSIAAGMFGVGGGVLLVPFLVLVLRRAQHVAHATSLVAILFAGASGGTRFAFDGAVQWVAVVALAVGAVAGAQLGARFLPKLTDTVLRRLFGVVLLVVAVRFVAAGSGGASGGLSAPDMDVAMLALHVVIGIGTGVSSAVLGVGGGTVLVPILVLLLGYGQHIAEGTSLFVIVPAALSGAIAHSRNGYTDWRLGGILGVAGILGGALGAMVALGLEPDTLGRLFGTLLFIVSALMLWPVGRARQSTPAPDAEAAPSRQRG